MSIRRLVVTIMETAAILNQILVWYPAEGNREPHSNPPPWRKYWFYYLQFGLLIIYLITCCVHIFGHCDNRIRKTPLKSLQLVSFTNFSRSSVSKFKSVVISVKKEKKISIWKYNYPCQACSLLNVVWLVNATPKDTDSHVSDIEMLQTNVKSQFGLDLHSWRVHTIWGGQFDVSFHPWRLEQTM